MPELLGRIETPTMILQAKDNELYPVSFAEDLQQSLTGIEDGAKLQIVHGASRFCILHFSHQASGSLPLPSNINVKVLTVIFTFCRPGWVPHYRTVVHRQPVSCQIPRIITTSRAYGLSVSNKVVE